MTKIIMSGKDSLPTSHKAGALKRTIRNRIFPTAESVKIFESRNGSGFEVYADYKGQAGDFYTREAEGGHILADWITSLFSMPQPKYISVGFISCHPSNMTRVYLYLNYTEGFTVTPLEML
jgi:hypothetical protein